MAIVSTARKSLNESARDAPRLMVQAAAEALRVGRDVPRALLLARSMRALTRSVEALDVREVHEAAGADTDFRALVEALLGSLAVSASDPDAGDHTTRLLERAQLRGLLERDKILAAEGGSVSGAIAAKLLGISPQAVHKRRKAGKLIGLSLGRRGFAYPVWQFGRSGTIAGLEAVLAELDEYDGWMQAAFMVAPNVRLDGRTPLEALRDGNPDAAVHAARTFGEHGAA